jgi:phosphatidylglycerophosphate synthase
MEVVSIKKGKGKGWAAGSWQSEYRKSLKPRETEEIVNQLINRPLAFVTAKAFQRLNRSPNFVTVFSLLFGVGSGFLFARGEYPYVLYAAVLLEMMIIFDCADGQLARMTGKSSSFGKTLDGLADMCTHMAIFYGVAYACYVHTGSILVFFYGLAAQLSMYLHIILYDHFKNVFISVSYPHYVDKLEPLDQMRGHPGGAEPDTGSGNAKRALQRLYYLFYRLESLIVSIGYVPFARGIDDIFPDPERIDSHTRKIYYREMRVLVKAWSFIGDTTHLTLFIVFGLLNKIELIFPAIVLFANLYMGAVLVYQRVKFRRLGLEKEVFWQERLD